MLLPCAFLCVRQPGGADGERKGQAAALFQAQKVLSTEGERKQFPQGGMGQKRRQAGFRDGRSERKVKDGYGHLGTLEHGGLLALGIGIGIGDGDGVNRNAGYRRRGDQVILCRPFEDLTVAVPLIRQRAAVRRHRLYPKRGGPLPR